MRTIDTRDVRTEAGGWATVELRRMDDGYAILEDGREIFTLREGDVGPMEFDAPEGNARFAFDVLTGRFPVPRAVTPFPWRMNESSDGLGYDIEAAGPDGVETVGYAGSPFVARAVTASTASLADRAEWEAARPAAAAPNP